MSDSSPVPSLSMDLDMDIADTENESSCPGLTPSRTTKSRILVMIGMAGAGKSEFTQRFARYCKDTGKTVYLINLDPASSNTASMFPFNIDIRDTLEYKKVMKEYKLGPNGGIITALNLFGTKFNGVLEIIQKRAKEFDYFLLDTPGQSECFTWSASGPVILQGLGSLLPTSLVLIMDTTRCKKPITFVNGTFYGIQVVYKNKLPMVVALNKADINPEIPVLLKSWLSDYDKLREVLYDSEAEHASKANSIALSIGLFYENVPVFTVSAKTGAGLDEFEAALETALKDYNEIYGAQLAMSRDGRDPSKIEVNPNIIIGAESKPLGGGEASSALFSYLTGTQSGHSGYGLDMEQDIEFQSDDEAEEIHVSAGAEINDADEHEPQAGQTAR